MPRRRKIQWILLLVTLSFIWGQSILSTEMSAQESGHITEFIRKILEVVFGQSDITDHIVRKLAHFSEYAVLGIQLWFWQKQRDGKHFWRAANAALVAAFFDETIQMLGDRGPMIADVWIDFAGSVAGIVAGILFLWIRKKKRKEKAPVRN